MASSGGGTPIEDLCARLSGRRLEIEQAVLTRICAVSNPVDTQSGEYAVGLRLAISAGVSHGLAGVELGDDRSTPVPLTLLSQTRQAARRGIGFDVLLRRYFAGYTLFGDFILQTVEDGIALRGSALRGVLNAQAVLFERLLLAVLGEYTRESENRHRPEQRQAERVRRLLGGEPVETGALEYEFDDWHVGAIACGDHAVAVLRDLADAADRRLLLIKPEAGTVWAWFGGRRRIAVAEFAQGVSFGEQPDTLVALGEPARGLEGWRLTHQQASEALWIARQGNQSVVRYADVGLLASSSRDHVLASSLRLRPARRRPRRGPRVAKDAAGLFHHRSQHHLRGFRSRREPTDRGQPATSHRGKTWPDHRELCSRDRGRSQVGLRKLVNPLEYLNRACRIDVAGRIQRCKVPCCRLRPE